MASGCSGFLLWLPAGLSPRKLSTFQCKWHKIHPYAAATLFAGANANDVRVLPRRGATSALSSDHSWWLAKLCCQTQTRRSRGESFSLSLLLCTQSIGASKKPRWIFETFLYFAETLERKMQTCHNYFHWENDFKGLTWRTNPMRFWSYKSCYCWGCFFILQQLLFLSRCCLNEVKKKKKKGGGGFFENQCNVFKWSLHIRMVFRATSGTILDNLAQVGRK